MKTSLLLSVLAILALGGGAAYYLIDQSSDHSHAHHDEHGHEHSDAGHVEASSPGIETTLSAEVARSSGVVTEHAGPATIPEVLAVYGQIKPNANHVARAVPRFGGFVREARKAAGETVTAGEVVAVVETNQSLVTLEVKAPISGVIIDRQVNAGETVADGTVLYTIADFSEVWVDLNIPRRDQSRVKVGQALMVKAADGESHARATISWISPTSSAEAQTLIARAVLDNTDQRWRPGLFITAEILIADVRVAVAVKESALQTLSDQTVVFSQQGDRYQARPIEPGRRGGGFVEVRHGLDAGEAYVSENSFLIKADIGKSGAAHSH